MAKYKYTFEHFLLQNYPLLMVTVNKGGSGEVASTEGHNMGGFQYAMYSILKPPPVKLLEKCNISLQSRLACKA